ncbi:hypothetical protein MRX96_023552 [Rhipicephalus microplus]
MIHLARKQRNFYRSLSLNPTLHPNRTCSGTPLNYIRRLEIEVGEVSSPGRENLADESASRGDVPNKDGDEQAGWLRATVPAGRAARHREPREKRTLGKMGRRTPSLKRDEGVREREFFVEKGGGVEGEWEGSIRSSLKREGRKKTFPLPRSRSMGCGKREDQSKGRNGGHVRDCREAGDVETASSPDVVEEDVEQCRKGFSGERGCVRRGEKSAPRRRVMGSARSYLGIPRLSLIFPRHLAAPPCPALHGEKPRWGWQCRETHQLVCRLGLARFA